MEKKIENAHMSLLLNQIQSAKIVNTYLFYDGPQFYSARSIDGFFYVFLALEPDDDRQLERWLIKPLSENTLLEFEYGLFTAKTLLSEKGDLVYIGFCSENGEFTDLECMLVSNLRSEDLPDDDTFFKCRENLFPIRRNTAQDAAKILKRPVLDFSLKKNRSNKKIKSHVVNDSLGLVQKINRKFSVTGASRSEDQERERDRLDLEIVEPFAASYGFRLAPVVDDLSDKEVMVISRSLDDIANLIQDASEYAKTGEKSTLESFNQLNLHQKGTFLSLTKIFAENDVDVTLEISSDGETTRTVVLDSNASVKFFESVENISVTKNTFTLKGALTAIDVVAGTFKIETTQPYFNNKKKFSGFLSESLKRSKFTVPMEISATIEVTTENNLLTEKKLHTYTLVKIR